MHDDIRDRCLLDFDLSKTIESFRFEYENEYEYNFTGVLTLCMRKPP